MKKLLLLLLLSGCAGEATGPAYVTPHKPKQNFTTIVLYRPAESWGDKGLAEVDISGKLHCKMHNGAFVLLNDVTGNSAISASRWGEPGTSRYSFPTDTDRIYYVKLIAKGDRVAAAILGGYIGMLAQEAMASTGGPFDFIPVEKKIAESELVALRQDCL